MLEYEIQSQITKHLKDAGILYYHYEAGRAGRGKRHNSGFPDLYVFTGDGKVIFFEIKTKTGKLNDRQLIIHAALKSRGYNVYTIRSFDDYFSIIEQHTDIKR